ncbi:MAG: caspase family protein [Bacteroidota bacterium]
MKSILLIVSLVLLVSVTWAQQTSLQKGHQAFREENYTQALSFYSQQIQQTPQHPAPYFWRGMTNWRLRKLEDVVSDLQKAIKLNYPDRDAAAYWKGVAEYELGDYAATVGSMTLALEEKYSLTAYVYQWRGFAYYELQDYANAIPDLKAAIAAKHPDLGELHFRLGEAYRVLRDKDIAVHHFEESLKAVDCPDPEKAEKEIILLRSELEKSTGEFLWIEPMTAVSEVRQNGLLIEACLSTNRRVLQEVQVEINGLTKYRLYPNDVPYSSIAGCDRRLTRTITLQPGENEIRLKAILDKGEIISDERIVNYQPRYSASQMPKVWAMIVGVASYTHARSLRYSDDDAYQMYAFLKSPEGGALPDEQIALLIDENATRTNILRQLENLFAKAGTNDLVLMYFSGHGLPGSFVPFDYNGEKATLLAHQDVQRIFRQTQARNRLCIADACHSGSLEGTRGLGIEAVTDRYYEALLESDGGMALLMSSKAEESSIEYRGLRQGVFSHYLIRGLRGEADSDQDGVVRIGELSEFVRKKTQSYTLHRQNPELHGMYDKRMPVGVVR